MVDCRAHDTDPDVVDNTTITVVAHIDSAFLPTADNNPIQNCADIYGNRVHDYDADATNQQYDSDCW